MREAMYILLGMVIMALFVTFTVEKHNDQSVELSNLKLELIKSNNRLNEIKECK